MKIKQLSLSLVGCIGAITLLESCQGDINRLETKQDCSAIFESRDSNNKKITSRGSEPGVASECKVLEVKLDDDTKCEIVGSDKIDNLTTIISENKGDRITLIAPENKLRDIGNSANKFLASKGISVKKYLDSEVFDNFDFPYEGMRCEVGNHNFVAWKGDKRVIITLD